MNTKALELVYKTHKDGREKAILLGDLILQVDGTGFHEDIQDTLKFFYTHIPLHFAYEEVMIRALLKSADLNDDEAAVIDKILREHQTLSSAFERINVHALKMHNGFDKAQKEDFLQLVTDTVESLIQHTEYEDRCLYPMADPKISDSLAKSIEQEMRRMVH